MPPSEPTVAVGAELDVPTMRAVLPHVCAKCGGLHELRGRFQVVKYTPPALYFVLLLGVLPGALLMAALTKKATVIIPLCASCDARWSSALRIFSLSLIFPFVLLVACWSAAVSLDLLGSGAAGPALAYLPFLVSIVAGPLLVRSLLIRPRTLYATSMDERRARLAGACPAMLAAVPRAQ